jgi:hypothetical protein
MTDVVDAVCHTQRQESLLFSERLEDAIEVARLLIDVESTEPVHLLDESPLLGRERRSREEPSSTRVDEEIVEQGDGEERWIEDALPQRHCHFPSVGGVVFPSSPVEFREVFPAVVPRFVQVPTFVADESPKQPRGIRRLVWHRR